VVAVDKISDPILAAKTYPQFLRAVALAYEDAPAVILRRPGIADQSLSYRDLESRSASLARGLLARGIGKGTRIGFIFGNGPEFVLIFSALARIGAVAIPISTLLKSNELVRVLRQADLTGLIVQRSLLGNDYADRMCEALPGLLTGHSPELRLEQTPYLRWIVSTGPDLPQTFRDFSWLSDEAGTVDESLLEEVEREVHSTDQLVEIYTSGSMALPKGVRHDHGPAIFRGHWIRAQMGLRTGEVYCPLPMFWVGGLMISLLPNMEMGVASLCSEGTPISSRYAMGSVLAPEDLAEMKQTPPFWGLGMSETLGPYALGKEFRAPGYPVCAPLDIVADRFEMRVADANGRPVADREIGEIQVRGYALSPGLHKIEREEYYTADGFYHTGDLGLVEGERVHFVGRDGDMIKSAGSNVSPAEVEMEMQALDGIHSAYVVGLPDAERGQLVAAAIVPREGSSIDPDAIQKELRQKLSPYKVPQAYILLTRDEVPMLFSNKVDRRRIRTLTAERLGRSL
jgi:acyl-CoA synthetase (AMP-forming)/AMP-acid ligase II